MDNTFVHPYDQINKKAWFFFQALNIYLSLFLIICGLLARGPFTLSLSEEMIFCIDFPRQLWVAIYRWPNYTIFS